MAYSISRRDLEYAHSVASRTASAVGLSKRKGEQVAGQIVQTALVGAAASAFGWISGYAGEVDVMGVPIDIGAAFVLQAAAYSGYAGSFATNLHALGDGAFAAWSTKKGAALGDAMRRRSGKGPAGRLGGTAAHGMTSGAERRPLSEAELVSMAHSVR
jgi:hypothetical protein